MACDAFTRLSNHDSRVCLVEIEGEGVMVEIGQCPVDTFAPGTWQRVLFYTPEPECKPFWTAMVWCKECGHPLNLVNHTIAADGQVTPSVGHPDIPLRCSWHPTMKLVGWIELPTPPPPSFSICERCGKKSRWIGGWGTWSKGTGIICGECFKEHMAQR